MDLSLFDRYKETIYNSLNLLYASMCVTPNTHPLYVGIIRRNIIILDEQLDIYRKSKELSLNQIYTLETTISHIKTILNYKGKELPSDLTPLNIENVLLLTENSPQYNFYMPILSIICNIKYKGNAHIGSLFVINDTIGVHIDENYTYSFNNNDVDTVRDKYWKYILSFDFSQSTFSEIVRGFTISSFPVSQTYNELTIGELCRCLTTNTTNINYNLSNVDRTYFNNLLKQITNTQHNLYIEDCDIFKELALYLNFPIEAINYLIGNSSTVGGRTALDSTSLRNYFNNFTSGMEDLDDDDDTDTDSEDEDEDDDDLETDEDTDTDDTDDDDDDDSESDDDSEEEESEDDPEEGTDTISSDDDLLPASSLGNITIELSPKDESIADIIYKAKVCDLVREYKKDPPPDLKIEELLLLENWCTKWIFLVSARTTKDLLSELSITV